MEYENQPVKLQTPEQSKNFEKVTLSWESFEQQGDQISQS